MLAPPASTRRTWTPLALALAATVAMAACGGDDEEGDRTSETTTTTAVETTTSSSPEDVGTDDTVAPADQATRDLAATAILQTADFGPGFTETAPSSEWTPTEESCAYQAGGPEELLGAGAAMNGPTVQLAETPSYAYSRAYVFPTEADAVAWAGIAATTAWSDCYLQDFQEFQDQESTEVEMSVETRDNDTLGQDGFEAFAQFYGRDASDRVALSIAKAVYRLGNVVIVTTIEDTAMGDASLQVQDGVYAALSAAYGRVSAASADG